MSAGTERTKGRARGIGRLKRLPFRMAVKIAWQNLRVRLGRSLLVTSGIILALAFLVYILGADTLARAVSENAPARVVEDLRQSGALTPSDADAQIQTRWMIVLALLISFVGVMNAMLLSVTERFREIGTMKCLGALDRIIVELFLLESLFQGMVGTSLGIMIGLAFGLLEAWRLFGGVLWMHFPLGALAGRVGLAFLAGLGLTVCGAIYAAWLAARMEPVDAMRMEV